MQLKYLTLPVAKIWANKQAATISVYLLPKLISSHISLTNLNFISLADYFPLSFSHCFFEVCLFSYLPPGNSGFTDHSNYYRDYAPLNGHYYGNQAPQLPFWGLPKVFVFLCFSSQFWDWDQVTFPPGWYFYLRVHRFYQWASEQQNFFSQWSFPFWISPFSRCSSFAFDPYFPHIFPCTFGSSPPILHTFSKPTTITLSYEPIWISLAHDFSYPPSFSPAVVGVTSPVDSYCGNLPHIHLKPRICF